MPEMGNQNIKPVVAAAVGDRVKIMTAHGPCQGVIERIDETPFPGKVAVRDDDGNLHDVKIGIGWLD